MTFQLPEMNFNSIAIRKNMMTATILTPKMFSLFDSLSQSDAIDAHILLRLRDLRKDCEECFSQSMTEAGRESPIPSLVFRRAAQFYALKDEAILSASIQEKILLWKLSLAESYQEYLYCPSRKPFSISNIRKFSDMDTPDLSAVQIQQELTDYADEMEAWLEIEFAEEYDDYCEQMEFDMFVKIIAALRMLSEQL